MKTTRRLTIINTPDRRWVEWAHCFSECEIQTVNEFQDLASALRKALYDDDRDVERVVIDGCAPAVSCLEFLASLPSCFNGDVLFIAQEGRTFLSATGRGGDRILYMLEPNDVLFYLQVHSAKPVVSIASYQDHTEDFPRESDLVEVAIPEGGFPPDLATFLKKLPMSQLSPNLDSSYRM
jgi:hypothetical protein